MPKQIVLLAGLHKTATTSIQRTCAANLEVLKAAGFAYPLTAGGEGVVPNHTALLHFMFRRSPHQTGQAGQLRDEGKQSAGRARQRAREVLDTRLKSAKRNQILAAEGVSLFSVEELTALRRWFAERGWQVRLLCHVRHLSGWINSMVAQRVTAGPRMTIPAAVDEFAQFGSIVRQRLENIQAVFPEAEFHSHERAALHPQGPAGFFLEALGIEPTQPLQIIRANEGRSDPATRLLSVLHEKFGRYLSDGQLNSGRLGDDLEAPIKRIAGNKFSLTRAEAAPILPLLEADNAWLRERFGDAFHDPALTFPDAPPAWTAQTREQVVAALQLLPAEVRAGCEARLADLQA